MTTITIAPLPSPLTCTKQVDEDVHQVEPGSVTLTAHAGDDLFADPSNDSLVMSASVFTFETTGDFQLRAKVRVDFRAKFDSGVLVGYFSHDKWFKICAEMDPLGNKRVVTVVTNGRSDDSNGTHLINEDIHLRITRTGRAFALHASSDGSQWDLARYFTLTEPSATILHVGIAAQSPAGSGTRVEFSEFGWNVVGVGDPRDGS